MDECKTAVEIFELLLKRVQENSIPLVLLRPREISEEISYEGDYDFFLPPEKLNQLLRMAFDLCALYGNSFTVNRYKYGKAVLVLHNHSDNRSIFLELWHILSVRDPHRHTSRYIFSKELEPHSVRQENGTYTFTLRLEALYYLSHLFTGRKKLSTPLVMYRMEYYYTRLKEINDPLAQWFFDMINAQETIEAVAERANRELVEMGVLGSMKNLKVIAREISTKMASSLYRLKRQWMQFLGHIPVVGADGVGKTTLIEKVMEKSSVRSTFFRFKKLFRSSPLYRLFFPWLSRRLFKELLGNVSIGKTEVDERYPLVVFVNALLMYPFRMMSSMITRRIVFIDRYFHDYLLCNVRLHTGAPQLRPSWKQWCRWIPQRYWFIHLDAPTDIIRSRKTELTEEGIASYRQDIFEIYLHKPFMLYSYINTNIPLEQCSDLVLEIGDIGAMELR